MTYVMEYYWACSCLYTLHLAEFLLIYFSYKYIREIQLRLFLNSLVTCQYNLRHTLVHAEMSRSCMKLLLLVFQLYMIGALME
jgi:hypothetical protein